MSGSTQPSYRVEESRGSNVMPGYTFARLGNCVVRTRSVWTIVITLAYPATLPAGEAPDSPTTSRFEREDRYALATGLEPLRTTSAPELRIWIEDYMSGAVTGFVITQTGQRKRCGTSSAFSDGVVVIERGSCRRLWGWARGQEVWQLVADLHALDGRRLHCPGIEDGIGFFIEGLHEGQRFALSGSNPDLCTDSPYRTVSAVLHLLPSL
jgi:hypothetical protein